MGNQPLSFERSISRGTMLLVARAHDNPMGLFDRSGKGALKTVAG
jgi:hypothetical protein